MFLPELKSKYNEDISILLKVDNHSFNYICECGDASDLTVKECQNTNAIFISHTHIDHFINFDFILRHQIGIQRRVIICGPQGITEQVQAKIKGYQWNLIEKNAITYEIREILNFGQIRRTEINPPRWEIHELGTMTSDVLYSNDLFEVHFTILDHKTDSIAYLFKEKDKVKIDLSGSDFKGGSWVRELKDAFENNLSNTSIEIENQQFSAQDLFHLLEIKKGDTVGIIMDHAAHSENHEKIKTLFSNCNKIFIESFYLQQDKEFAQQNFHSYSAASGKIANAYNVRKAIPVHFSRKYKEDEIKILIEQFEIALNGKEV